MARKTLPIKYKNKAKEIKEYFLSINHYKSIDDNLINELVFSIYLADEAKKNILENGILVNG